MINEADWGINNDFNMRRDSQNADMMRRSAAYIAAAVLSQPAYATCPQHAQTILADGRAVTPERHARWEASFYEFTRWRTLHGLFGELGAAY